MKDSDHKQGTATVLALLATQRRHGFTASVLQAAAEGAAEVEGVEVETLPLAQYDFGPCRSTFWCVRHQGQGCGLVDDLGRRGEGVLFAKVRDAHGLILATPVHTWGPSALAHTFWERMYPFLWNDHLNGMAFGCIACATNQGFHGQAVREMSKWAFNRGMLYCGGIAAHVMDREQRTAEAREMGRRVGEAAAREAREGRRRFSDEERWDQGADLPYPVLDEYLANITEGTGDLAQSLPARALRDGVFRDPQAVDLLRKALAAFEDTLAAREAGDHRAAMQHLRRASAYWTNATWIEYVQHYIAGSQEAEVYRKLPEATGKLGN